MRLQAGESEMSAFLRCFASRKSCPDCGDRLVAPELSEFVNSGEIRHYWACEACGNTLRTTVELIAH